jgi:flagella basal body P-ring formation protein FlgA
VAHAAPLGLDAVLDADEVQLAARRAGYDWRNASGFHRIVVTATASPPAEAARDPARAKAAVRGRRAAAALVYARNITSGDVLRAEDLIWSDDAVAPSDAVMDPDAAIGKVARHALRAGAPTADRDLASPVLIRRDDVVSVIFETDGVSLTLQGKALSDASVGRGVEVMNTQSKKIIQAVCDGPDEAVVGPRAEALRASSPSDPFAAFAKASLH